jgi:hypothetical protein
LRTPYRSRNKADESGLRAGAAAQQRRSRAPVRVVIESRRDASARPLTIACVAVGMVIENNQIQGLEQKDKINQIQGLEQKDSAERFE